MFREDQFISCGLKDIQEKWREVHPHVVEANYEVNFYDPKFNRWCGFLRALPRSPDKRRFRFSTGRVRHYEDELNQPGVKPDKIYDIEYLDQLYGDVYQAAENVRERLFELRERIVDLYWDPNQSETYLYGDGPRGLTELSIRKDRLPAVDPDFPFVIYTRRARDVEGDDLQQIAETSRRVFNRKPEADEYLRLGQRVHSLMRRAAKVRYFLIHAVVICHLPEPKQNKHQLLTIQYKHSGSTTFESKEAYHHSSGRPGWTVYRDATPKHEVEYTTLELKSETSNE